MIMPPTMTTPKVLLYTIPSRWYQQRTVKMARDMSHDQLCRYQFSDYIIRLVQRHDARTLSRNVHNRTDVTTAATVRQKGVSGKELEHETISIRPWCEVPSSSNKSRVIQIAFRIHACGGRKPAWRHNRVYFREWVTLHHKCVYFRACITLRHNF
jgi:hypothetical protein